MQLNHHLSAFEGCGPVPTSMETEMFPSIPGSLRPADGDEMIKKKNNSLSCSG